MDAPRPTSVDHGRYALGGQLGQGSTASVYQATDRMEDRAVAVKLMPVPSGARASLGTRFLAEARVLAEIRHPHVLRVYRSGTEAGWHWFVMDLADRSLTQRLNSEGRMAPDEALRTAFAIASALHAVHGLGLVHRDVKPDNVLYVKGHVVLADFGIARHPDGVLPAQTRPGQSLGTQGYRAPEQEDDGHEVGPESDLYGLAATLYSMLTRKRPPPSWQVAPEALHALPPDIAELMRHAMDEDRAERFATAEEMARAIAETAGAPEWMERFAPQPAAEAAATRSPLAALWRFLGLG